MLTSFAHTKHLCVPPAKNCHWAGASRNKVIRPLLSPFIHDEAIVRWCEKNGTDAKYAIAQMMPLFDDNDKTKMHEFAKRMIDEFGNEEAVRRAIDCNLGTFGWSGSLVPYYQRQLSIFQGWHNHKNPEVRRWAREREAELNKTIDDEKTRDEEGLFGKR